MDDDSEDDDDDQEDPLGKGVDSVSWLPSVVGKKGGGQVTGAREVSVVRHSSLHEIRNRLFVQKKYSLVVSFFFVANGKASYIYEIVSSVCLIL